MDIEIRKLSLELLDDWLEFFDNPDFCDNDEWSGCYCTYYHWSKELASKKKWNCSKYDTPYNRECAIDFIKNGILQGYLAYYKQKVIGWCNANDKQAYNSVNFSLPVEESEADKKVKAIVCFRIAPDFRGKGVASRLLERICTDAAKNGYEYVESYPFDNDGHNAYHGPASMYEKQGFVPHKQMNGYSVFRKYLN